MTLSLVSRTSTDAEFVPVFNRLVVALREPADDSGATLEIYWDVLKDLPLAAIEAGAMALMRERGRRFFPTTAEWRQAAETAQMQLLREAVKPARDAAWQHDCTACEDTGWQYHDCDERQPCGRNFKHAAHRYVSICPCRPTNRTWARHQHFGSGE